MKTTIIILLLAVAACAKKNPNYKGNPIKDLLEQQQQQQQPDQSFSFKVKTKNLDFLYPNKEKTGKIVLIVKDAKALYDALRIKSSQLEDTEKQQTVKTKQGHNLKCFEIHPLNINERTRWGCEMDFRYEEGLVNVEMDDWEVDEEVPQLSVDKIGHNLTLKAGQSQLSTISFKQNSALMLYNFLTVPEFEIDPVTKVKKGQDYICTKVISLIADDNYTCELTFDHETGQVIQQN